MIRNRYTMTVFIIVFLLLGNHRLANSAFQATTLGARPLGIGSAFVSIADDANAVFYNPGGIALTTKREFNATYSKPYLGLENIDISFLQVSAAAYISWLGKIGLGIYQFNAGNLYTEYSYSIGAAERIFSFKPIGIGYFGVLLKIIGHTYKWDKHAQSVRDTYGDTVISAGNTKSAFSIDTGILIKRETLSFGLSLHNLNQPDIGLKYKDIVPMVARFGISYRIRKIDLLVATGGTFRNQSWGNKLSYNIGLEKPIKKIFALRTGLTNEGISLGAGANVMLKSVNIKLDLAYLHSLIELPAPSMYISTGITF